MSLAAQFGEVIFDTEELKAKRKRSVERVLRAGKAAITETGRDLEKAYEDATAAAGLGKLAKAWNSKVYPEGAELSDNPAAIVYPKGRARTEGAIKAYSEGATIRGKGGRFLAIALPAAGARYTGKDRAPITPTEWERRTGSTLVFVPPTGRRKVGLLVLEEGVLGGKKQIARKNTEKRRATGRGNQTIPIFILVPVVNVRRRLDLKSIRAPYPQRLAANFKAKLSGLSDA